MNTKPLQHALREMRAIFSIRLTQLILGAVVLLLAISGPFGTLDGMGFAQRLAYWAFTAPLTFAVGVFVSTWASEKTRHATAAWIRPGAIALSTGIAVSITVLLINWIGLGDTIFAPEVLAPLLLSVIATAALIALLLHYLLGRKTQDTNVPPKVPALLSRLDLAKRGGLISLSVQDHYVEVSTTQGTSLLLMRLSDAIRETDGIEGLQIHRSHWVARDHIIAAKRNSDKALLTLSDGRTLPASRSKIAALKEAGILPRSGQE